MSSGDFLVLLLYDVLKIQKLRLLTFMILACRLIKANMQQQFLSLILYFVMYKQPFKTTLDNVANTWGRSRQNENSVLIFRTESLPQLLLYIFPGKELTIIETCQRFLNYLNSVLPNIGIKHFSFFYKKIKTLHFFFKKGTWRKLILKTNNIIC